mmetsp:Transcript_1167/g.2044  ORF Transcript_1167/g.2044 Transcript_1167/m.2044 type:complete len:215 (-) Transcript_1167:249-893(-)
MRKCDETFKTVSAFSRVRSVLFVTVVIPESWVALPRLSLRFASRPCPLRLRNVVISSRPFRWRRSRWGARVGLIPGTAAARAPVVIAPTTPESTATALRGLLRPQLVIHARTPIGSHLRASDAAPKLASLLKTPVEVHPDGVVVQRGAIDVLHTVFRVLTCVVHHKAKAAWGFPLGMQPHDDALYISALGEHLVDLFLRGVEREIPYVDGGGGA